MWSVGRSRGIRGDHGRRGRIFSFSAVGREESAGHQLLARVKGDDAGVVTGLDIHKTEGFDHTGAGGTAIDVPGVRGAEIIMIDDTYAYAEELQTKWIKGSSKGRCIGRCIG